MAKKKKTKKQKQARQDKLDRIANIKSLRRAVKAPKYGILAIDPATTTGWAFSCPKGAIFGIHKVTKKAKDSVGVKWCKYEIWLKSLFSDLGKITPIKFVIYEMPVTRFAGATIHHSKLACLIEKVCAEQGIEFDMINPKTIKKFITGNGNASKEEVMVSIEKYHGYNGDSDDISDALGILFWQKAKLL